MHSINKKIKKSLKVAIILTSLFFIIEIIGGIISGSLSLLGDAAHMFRDILALLISLGAVYLSEKLPTEEKTFGYHRLEIFAALINGILLIGISIWIFAEAYQRLLNPVEIKSGVMLGVALAGLVINIYVAQRLHGSKDVNIKSTFIHVLTDTLSSGAVIIASVIIHFTDLYIVDPILSFGIGLFILFSTYRIIKESIHILLEYVPDEIDLNELIEKIEEVEGVEEIHNVHFWTLCSNINMMDAHIYTEVDDVCEAEKLKCRIKEFLRKKYNVKHATLEFEWTKCKINEKLTDIRH